MDLTFIEVMPMGDLGNEDRLDQYWSLKDLRARLAERFTLIDLAERTGGPARYVQLQETGQKIGFITPLTHNFCESCNRVRLTCTGELYMCLGQEDMADLRAPLRASPTTRCWRTPSAPPSNASPRATISTIPARRWTGRSAGT
jgi:cyclic pyranopterin phosphate synthase